MKIRANFKCEDCKGHGYHHNWETYTSERCKTCNATGNGETFTIDCNAIAIMGILENVARKFPNAQNFTYL